MERPARAGRGGLRQLRCKNADDAPAHADAMHAAEQSGEKHRNDAEISHARPLASLCVARMKGSEIRETIIFIFFTPRIALRFMRATGLSQQEQIEMLRNLAGIRLSLMGYGA